MFFLLMLNIKKHDYSESYGNLCVTVFEEKWLTIFIV